MSIIPKIKIGLFNSYLIILFYLFLTMIISYFSDKDGFKRGADESWLEDKDKFKMHLSGYIFYGILLVSIFIPIKTGTNLFNVGIFIYIISLILSIYTGISFVTAPKDRLITKGIYKYSRNPVYFCNILVILSTAFISGTAIYLIFLAIYLLTSYFTIRVEEKYLLQRYSSEYREYLTKTPRYIIKTIIK
ncbi:MAG: isoprenylcysteine carboxylmethyltransferase family protein [Tissierellia bacterium]|nr:isoprenylcysteine carboxylmethyltransferase family protein [Tissierellia bacterium]